MELTTYSFPDSAVQCEPGNYLLCQTPENDLIVYRVRDLLLVKRLIPLKIKPPALVIEDNLLDSVAPTYRDEVHLLLTSFENKFTSQEEAVGAVQKGLLTESTSGLLRNAHDFPRTTCSILIITPK